MWPTPYRQRHARLACVASPVVLLHGFAGTARHWDRVRAMLDPGRVDALALDLSDTAPLTVDGVAALVALRAPERFALAGYSMGGRVALHAALAMPERVTRLVLISASAGIADELERAARRESDEGLAVAIEAHGIEAFIERWREVPIFAGDPPEVRDAVAADERRSSPATLAASLRGLGPGVVEPMWDRLGELRMPVAILAGQRDVRYVETGRRLAAAIAGSTLEIVPGAGHRLALEAPAAVAAALESPQ
jgi:2-succinyl-6-hydroxy-2,4-cyclohexadiene-1-carboxylate synthase